MSKKCHTTVSAHQLCLLTHSHLMLFNHDSYALQSVPRHDVLFIHKWLSKRYCSSNPGQSDKLNFVLQAKFSQLKVDMKKYWTLFPVLRALKPPNCQFSPSCNPSGLCGSWSKVYHSDGTYAGRFAALSSAGESCVCTELRPHSHMSSIWLSSWITIIDFKWETGSWRRC